MNETQRQNDVPSDVPVVRARVKRAVRDQVQWRDASLEQLVPKDHRVRAVWAAISQPRASDHRERRPGLVSVTDFEALKGNAVKHFMRLGFA